MSDYEQLLDDIVAVLSVESTNPEQHPTLHTTGTTVKKLDEYKGQYKPLDPVQKSRVLVSFSMERFGTEKDSTEFLIGANGQTSDVYVMLSVAARRQFGEHGTFRIIQVIKKNLIGFPCQAGGVLSGFSIELFNFVDGTWYWEMLFRVRNFITLPYKDYSEEEPIHDGVFTRFDIDEGNCERAFVSEGSDEVVDENGATIIDEI